VTTEEQPPSSPAVPGPSEAERHLIVALTAGDEAAFVTLVELYHASLVRLALTFVQSHAVAEEVVQETWIGVLTGLPRFEGRSSLKTWIFRILSNQAKTRGVRERRTVPFSAFEGTDGGDAEPALDPSRFAHAAPYPGHWTAPPSPWDEDTPERLMLDTETRERITSAIAALPSNQRQVITLRDVEGWSAPEVCNVLGLSETNQRVLLHRARSRVRRAIETYLEQAHEG